MDRLKKTFSLLLVVLVIVSVAAAGYFYFKYREASNNNNQAEVEQVVNEIGKLMLLPDETPSLATVVDKEQLNQQEFLQAAENGDKVLIYPQNGKAILYRPSIGRIIDVVPVKTIDNIVPNENDLTPSPTPPERVEENAQVVLYNGTTTAGITADVSNQLLSSVGGIEIIERQSANRTDYVETLVIDISGKFPEKAAEMSAELNASIQPLPSDEVIPAADILVIVGSNSVP